MRLMDLLVFFTAFFITLQTCTCLSCHPNLTVVERGHILPIGDLQAGEYTYSPRHFERFNSTHFRVCICTAAKCLRKCCPPGTAYVGKNCTATNLPLTVEVYDKNLKLLPSSELNTFRLIEGETCKEGKYRLTDEDPADAYKLLITGDLYMPNISIEEDRVLPFDQFCVDNIIIGSDATTEIVLVCFQNHKLPEDGTIYPIGMIISIPFLLATLLVYSCIPELRNMHGKNLMCQVSSLVVGYIFLVIITVVGRSIETELCIASGFLVQFSFLATFFWLNVMSFDIWWAFSGFKGFKGSVVEREHKTFLAYSAYAWGGPLIMVAVSMGLDLSPNIPDYVLKPGIGTKTCWINTELATLAYFYGPVACILVANIIFFALTAYKILRVKRDTKVLDGSESRKNSDANKQRYFLYLKLFLIMGVNWMMEVISWAVGGPKEVWYLTDVCNSLQGVLIFWLFIASARKTRGLLVDKIRNSARLSQKTTRTTVSMRSSRGS